MTKNKTSTSNLKSDALVKKIMSEKIAATEFLQEYLPQNLKAQLDLTTLEVKKESYVEESLRRQLSDLVYLVKTKDKKRDAFVYVLLEAQSKVDHKIAFRLWKYTLLLLERHINDKAKLPLVAPIVLYHGKAKYTAVKSLWQLFEDPDTAKELMSDEHMLIDLESMADDDIKKKQHLGMLEFFLKHIHDRDMIKLWKEFFESFEDMILLDKQNGYIYIKSFLYYTDAKLENNKKEELTRVILTSLPKEDGEDIMYTIADGYIDQGIEKGIVIGKAEGKAEVAKSLLSKNIDHDTISSATGLSIDQITSLSKLD